MLKLSLRVRGTWGRGGKQYRRRSRQQCREWCRRAGKGTRSAAQRRARHAARAQSRGPRHWSRCVRRCAGAGERWRGEAWRRRGCGVQERVRRVAAEQRAEERELALRGRQTAQQPGPSEAARGSSQSLCECRPPTFAAARPLFYSNQRRVIRILVIVLVSRKVLRKQETRSRSSTSSKEPQKKFKERKTSLKSKITCRARRCRARRCAGARAAARDSGRRAVASAAAASGWAPPAR